jgi:hypothetical protein
MKAFWIVATFAVLCVAGCDGRSSGNQQESQSTQQPSASTRTREGGTATPSVPTKPGEKPSAVSGSTASAQAERGSGIEGTTSAGATAGTASAGSIGQTPR